MIWTLPNTLTTLRLVAALFVPVMFLWFHRPWADAFALALFVGAALTDFLDGWIARAWKQESAFGRMLDPIADKTMVVIALMVLAALSGMDPLVVLPATAILFREVFVSGLREYLGDRAGLLRVTRLAKWKTTVQMLAIAALFGRELAAHHVGMLSLGMGPEIMQGVLAGEIEDVHGLRWKYHAMMGAHWGGLAALWLAAGLTLATGWDYFTKALPHLREREGK